MSYTIFYKSMFVKLSNGKYIPMMEMGDNNVYECSYGPGKAKRVRTWSNKTFNGWQKFYTYDEISDALDKWYTNAELKRQEDLLGDNEWKKENAKTCAFGYYEGVAVYGKDCFGTTFANVKNMVLGGVKNCISFEDAVKKCGLCFSWCEKDDWKRENITSEEQMYDFIEKTLGGENNEFWFGFKSWNVEKVYKTNKAMKDFAKLNGKKARKFRVVTCDKGCYNRRYLCVKDGQFVLDANIENATFFNKHESNGVDMCELIYTLFPDVYSYRCLYNENEVG